MSLVHNQMTTGKLLLCCILTLSICTNTYSQTLPEHRTVNWSLAGFRGNPIQDNVINILDFGAIADGFTDNTNALNDAIAMIVDTGGIIFFPAGDYRFNSNITLTDHIILQGAGAAQTTLSFDLGGSDDLIQVKGMASEIFSDFTTSATKGQTEIDVENTSEFTIGDYIRIIQDDEDLVYSDWAIGTVGQIVKIKNIVENTLVLESELRKDFLMVDHPKIQQLDMVENVGISCLKIKRLDETNPIQTSNIKFQYASQSWVQGVESEDCNFAHVNIWSSTNISITGSYFHDAFDYGGGGRAYGVMIQSTGNENLIENNIFEHLRHAMIVQSGANGNVFAYNYSIDPFWTGTSLPSNAAGDLVCHGNYAYANLFEGNIGQQIVIDNSHGANGPYNTFVRNRAELYGIVMSADNSPSQNFLANEIPNGTPGAIGFYYLQGVDHFESGNNLGGNITPEGTDASLVESCYLTEFPSFFTQDIFPNIGMPNLINSNSIPGKDRRTSNGDITLCSPFCANGDLDNICDTEDNCPSISNSFQEDIDEDGIGDACDNCINHSNADQLDSNGNGIGDACETLTSIIETNVSEMLDNWEIYPNPTSEALYINLKTVVESETKVLIYNHLGQQVFQKEVHSAPKTPMRISVEAMVPGTYLVQIITTTGDSSSKLLSIIK